MFARMQLKYAWCRLPYIQDKKFSTTSQICDKTIIDIIFEHKTTDIKKLGDEQRRFEYDHQRAIALTKIPNSPLKSIKENALARPWDGEESPLDTSRRMLEDSVKPLKVDRSQRLSNARENSMDYILNKESGEDRGKTLEVSRKRRYGGISSGLSSGGWVESFAGKEVENAIKQGKFKSIPRGESALALRDEFLTYRKNPNIDFTEYLLNNIIKKQGGAPPWIMKQQAVSKRILQFRNQIVSRLQERLVHRLLAVAKFDVKLATKLAHTGLHNKDTEWEELYKQYHADMIDGINKQIRGYNLQAPPSARWGYLNVDDEIRKCYSSVTIGVETALEKYAGHAAVPKVDKNSLHTSLPPLEDPKKHYGFKQLIQDILKKN